MRRAALIGALSVLAAGVLGLVPHLGWSIRTGKLALLEVVLLATAAALIRPGWLRGALWLALLGFVLHYNARSAVTVWRLLMAALGIHVLAASLTSRQLPSLLTGWRVITLINTGYMLLQLLGVDPLFVPVQPGASRIVGGLLDGGMLAGAYTAMTLPLFAPPRWRWALGPSVVAIVATQSLGAVVVMSVLLAWIIGWRWALAGVAAVGVVFTLAIEPIGLKLREETRAGRFPVWRMGLGMMRHGPLSQKILGVGPGQYALQIKRYHARTQYRPRAWMDWSRAHNEPLQAFQEFGLIGLLLWLACVGRWLRAGWEAWEPEVRVVLMVAVGWLLCSLYTFAAHTAGLAVVGIVAAGVLEGVRRRGDGAYA